jgi:hypothetical protein
MRIAQTVPIGMLILMQVTACSGRNPVAPDVASSDSTLGVASIEPVKAVSAAVAQPIILSLPDDSPGPPIYAAIARFFMNTDGEWVAIELVRERGCIPPDFNLMQFSDIPRAFGCHLTIGGTEWWYPEDLADGPWTHVPPLPFQARLVGQPGMLMYFVKLSELNATIADGILTIGELENLPSFLKGHIDSYLQVQHNSNLGQAPGHSDTTSRGRLEDGRSFFYQKTDRDNEALSVQISFR